MKLPFFLAATLTTICITNTALAQTPAQIESTPPLPQNSEAKIVKDSNLNAPNATLADYNRAIALNPSDAKAYNNRGVLKGFTLNDPQGALVDYNQAIALNPSDAKAYNNRGGLKAFKLNDYQGAIADFNQAIALKPNYASAYNNRGGLKAFKLNDYHRQHTVNPN